MAGPADQRIPAKCECRAVCGDEDRGYWILDAGPCECEAKEYADYILRTAETTFISESHVFLRPSTPNVNVKPCTRTTAPHVLPPPPMRPPPAPAISPLFHQQHYTELRNSQSPPSVVRHIDPQTGLSASSTPRASSSCDPADRRSLVNLLELNMTHISDPPQSRGGRPVRLSSSNERLIISGHIRQFRSGGTTNGSAIVRTTN
jgi:hypothetical protein